jgi:ABC-type branched-subunit amino acid transport system permease subunit
VGFFWFGTPLIQEDLPDFLGSHVFSLRQFAIGLMIVLVLLLRPQGLFPEETRVSRFVRSPTRSRWRFWRRTAEAAA